MNVCAFTSICEEDRIWIPQYLAEAERLHMPFVMHFDRCAKELMEIFKDSKYCVGATAQLDKSIEFNETHKQALLDEVVAINGCTNDKYGKLNFHWAMAWDIDETYEKHARRKIKEFTYTQFSSANKWDLVDTRWVNLWGDSKHIRTDGPFASGHRVKFYNLRSGRWKFDSPITNGAKLLDKKGNFKGNVKVRKSDLVCLHWGMMTRELRELHKKRWDRIYSAAVGNNPYGFWNYACDEETYPPVLKEHDYL